MVVKSRMTPAPSTRLQRFLGALERAGNRLPDPALLFVLLLAVVFVLSAVFGNVTFETPGKPGAAPETQKIISLLEGPRLVAFIAGMVQTFVLFHPLGVVLVAMLGLGVAEHSGFINCALKAALGVTPKQLLSPMVALAAILSHTAADAGYVLVIPLGGILFHAAGRHPLAGIACAFAGVSGGFGANFIPSGLDPLLQGITQQAAQMADPEKVVNPLCNWYFAAASSVLVILVVWFVTDRVIEPRLMGTVVDGDEMHASHAEPLSPREKRALVLAFGAFAFASLGLALWAAPADSPWRFTDATNPGHPQNGSLVAAKAPLMLAIVPLIFLLSLVPGLVYGFAAGTLHSHRDIFAGMAKSMSAMGQYLVLAFFAALFIQAFGDSKLGLWLAVMGARALEAMALHPSLTLTLMILLVGSVNLLIGSASAKWALLAPVLVPMLARAGFPPETVQAGYRVGDSTTNIITPLLPYFPLILIHARRHVRGAGLGTLISLMLPYSVVLLVCWTAFFLVWHLAGWPFGLGG
jgi:aminobenzoyl-glutamate transport protein